MAAWLLSGCVASPPVEELVVDIPEQRPIPIIKADPVPPVDQTPKTAGPPPEPPNVAVVLTSRSPAYEEVAVALAEYFADVLIYDLTDKSQSVETAFKSINDGDTDAVVAIGLKAAKASVMLASPPVVFSQIFNFNDNQLLRRGARGVAAYAPVDAQLSAWKDLEPGLSRVGLVIGPGHDALLEEAEIAADQLGVELNVKVAKSDQETLFYFKRMVQEIDGFWLMPDNRVLSGRVLREMIAMANRREVSVLVPSQSMLSIGASVSVSTVASDIAARIHDIVLAVDSGRLDAVPAITPLTEVVVETNDAMFKQSTVASREGGADGPKP
ncbi:MAG: ABC transporter substrate binding protein [Pseudomonadota bacterium]